MTVKQLIFQLSMIENQDALVVYCDDRLGLNEIYDLISRDYDLRDGKTSCCELEGKPL